jgi:hypothetical protein
MAWSKRPTVSTRMCRFLPLTFLPASYPCGSMHAPFFCAFHALAVDEGGGRTGFPLLSLATLVIERVVDSFQRAVICPQIEVVVDGASRQQVFRGRAPPDVESSLLVGGNRIRRQCAARARKQR